MICKKCGKTISDNAKFCSQCGEKVEVDNISENISEEEANENVSEEIVQDAEQNTEIENIEIKGVQKKKKRVLPFIIGGSSVIVVGIIFAVLFTTHIICFHDWVDANCMTPKTCSICEKTEGEPLGHNFSEATCTKDAVCSLCGEIDTKAFGHDWTEATCTEDAVCKTCGEHGDKATGHNWKNATCLQPKTCAECGKTEGKAAGHKWQEATCEAPKTCSVCGETSGESLGHNWKDATYTAPKTCSRCGETSGEKLVKATCSTSFSVYNLGVSTAAHEIIIVTSVTADNGTATVSGISMWGTTAADTIIVSGCTEGPVTITGTIMTLAQDTSQRGPFSFTATGYAR